MVRGRHKERVPRDKSRVRHSPWFREISECFQSGWSAGSVWDYLQWRYGDAPGLPSVWSLERWRAKHLPDSKILPHSLIVAKLKGIDYKVDLFTMLSQLLPLLRDRAAGAMQLEETSLGGMPVTATDRAVQTFLEAARDWRALAEDFGVLPKRPVVPHVSVTDQRQMMVIDPQTAKELAEYARTLVLATGTPAEASP